MCWVVLNQLVCGLLQQLRSLVFAGTRQVFWMWQRELRSNLKPGLVVLDFYVVSFSPLGSTILLVLWNSRVSGFLLSDVPGMGLVMVCGILCSQFPCPCLQTLFLWAGNREAAACVPWRSRSSAVQLLPPWGNKPQWSWDWLTKAMLLLPQWVLWFQCNFLCKGGQQSEERFHELKEHRCHEPA